MNKTTDRERKKCKDSSAISIKISLQTAASQVCNEGATTGCSWFYSKRIRNAFMNRLFHIVMSKTTNFYVFVRILCEEQTEDNCKVEKIIHGVLHSL